MSHRPLCVVTAFALIAASWQPVHAAFLVGFAGNTRMFDEPASDGTVNFAVYENTDGDWTDDFPVFLSAFANPVDAAAKYVYFYSVTNENPSPEPQISDGLITQLQISNGGGPGFTSGGEIGNPRFGSVFVEVGLGGRVGPDAFFAPGSPNARLGLSADGAPVNSDSVDGLPSELYAGPIAFDILLGPHPLSTITLDDANDLATVTWTQSPIPSASDRFSSVVFLTANNPPQFLRGAIGAGVSMSSGDIPAPLFVPEGASNGMALVAILCAPLSIHGRRRGRPSKR